MALTFVAAIDEADRFRSSRAVPAHFGLTPRKYQSGETDYTGRISKVGDASVRIALYEAAHIILTRLITGSDLKTWALGVARRSGLRKAAVALARKLAAVPHRMLRDQTDFIAHKAAGATMPALPRRRGIRRRPPSVRRSEVPSPGRCSGQIAICYAAPTATAFVRSIGRSSTNPIKQRPRADCGQKQVAGGRTKLSRD